MDFAWEEKKFIGRKHALALTGWKNRIAQRPKRRPRVGANHVGAREFVTLHS